MMLVQEGRCSTHIMSQAASKCLKYEAIMEVWKPLHLSRKAVEESVSQKVSKISIWWKNEANNTL